MVRFAQLIAALTLVAAWPGGLGAESDPNEASAWPLDDLGTLERYAVRQALEGRDWTIDPNPDAKRVVEVHVVTLPVFSKRQSRQLRWFNRLHATTEPEVVRRDVLLEPGDTWNDADVRETERLLRDPTFTSLAVVVPVATDSPETVDVLVVTRDIWSLRPSLDFEYQDGTLSDLFVSVSETNLLGRHKAPGGFFQMELGRFAFGPRYYDPQVFGSQVEFSSQGRAIFSRETGNFEGSRSSTTIAYPLWNLDRTWGGELTVSHTDEIIREFRGTNLLPYNPPDLAADRSAPYKYRYRTFDAEALGRYATGEAIEHQLSAGYRFHFQRAALPPDFPDDPQLEAAFRRDILPAYERNSGPVFGYTMFLPEWHTYRNISTYDLPEEKRLGPYLELEVSPALEPLGSVDGFVGLSATAGGLVDLMHDGFVTLEGAASTRRRGGGWTDTKLTGLAKLATPDAFELVRLVGRSQFEWLIEDTQNRLLLAGGLTGLRGYAIGAFAGDTRWLNNLELRTMPVDAWVTKIGGVVFWDAGAAADSPGQLGVRHDVGLGMRILIPQANTLPLRVDWALPVGSRQPTLPGRLTFGFDQVF